MMGRALLELKHAAEKLSGVRGLTGVPSSIVHLSNCKRELAPLLKGLDGWEHSYFELLLQLATAVLRHGKVKEARLIVAREATYERKR